MIFDGNVLAREGSAGPLPGTIWGPLINNGVDVNRAGNTVFRGEFEFPGQPTIKALFRDGLPYLQSGDTNPSIAPWSFVCFGNQSLVRLGEDGSIVYFARTTNPEPLQDSGYFVDRTSILQEGVSTVGGRPIQGLFDFANSMAVSVSGRYMVLTSTIGESTDGLLLIDLGLVSEMSSAEANVSRLRHSDGLPLLGAAVEFELDLGQALGVTPVFVLSADPVAGWPPFGLTTPYGELLIDLTAGLGNSVLARIGNPWTGAPVAFTVAVPSDLTLAGSSFFAQGLFWDVGQQSGATPFQLSNGLQVELGF